MDWKASVFLRTLSLSTTSVDFLTPSYPCEKKFLQYGMRSSGFQHLDWSGVGVDKLCGSHLTSLPCSIIFPVVPDPNPQEDDAKFSESSKIAEDGPSRASRLSKTFSEVPIALRVSQAAIQNRGCVSSQQILLNSSISWQSFVWFFLKSLFLISNSSQKFFFSVWVRSAHWFAWYSSNLWDSSSWLVSWRAISELLWSQFSNVHVCFKVRQYSLSCALSLNSKLIQLSVPSTHEDVTFQTEFAHFQIPISFFLCTESLPNLHLTRYLAQVSWCWTTCRR